MLAADSRIFQDRWRMCCGWGRTGDDLRAGRGLAGGPRGMFREGESPDGIVDGGCGGLQVWAVWL